MNRRRFFAALAVLPAALLALGRERRNQDPNAWWNNTEFTRRSTDCPELNNHGPMFTRAAEDHRRWLVQEQKRQEIRRRVSSPGADALREDWFRG